MQLPLNALDRPLRVSEVFAEAIRFYADRIWAALGLGLVVASAFILAGAVPVVLGVAIIAAAFTAVYAAAARLVSGDSFKEAWAEVGLRAPVLAVLALVVAVPFAVAVGYIALVIVAVAWLGLTGFSIPVAMLEREPEREGWFVRLGYALRRSVALARTEYLHAVGVSAALVIVYLLIGILLAGALVGFADNSGFAAVVLVQVVLAPFFFIGLSVLYFEQKARALSSSRHES